MAAPQVVVFDLGKVLLDFDYGILAPKIAAQGRVTAAQVNEILNQSPLLHRYETGLMTTGEFFAEVRTATGFRGALDEFSALFADIFSPIPPMIELQATLRKKGVRTSVFSNTNDLAISHIRRQYPFFSNFDDYILSHEHGSMKPNARLYEVVEAMTQRRGAEILYLDDRAENVAAGAARGWHAVLHENAEKSVAALQAAGLLD